VDDRTLDDVRGRTDLVVDIDDYGYKGEGYVRLADGWLSVPGALPGERVRVSVEEGHPRTSRLYGRVEEVIEASSHRRDPLCELDDVCRGCQLRHATIGEELRFHVETVAEVIEKYAELDEDERPPVELITPQPISRGDAFRIRSNLTYRRDGDACSLGLVTPVRESLIPMDTCPALTTPVRRLIATVESCFEQLDSLPWDTAMADEVGSKVDRFEPEPGLENVHVMSPVYGRGMVDLVLTSGLSEQRLDAYVTDGAIAPLLETLTHQLPEEVGLGIKSGDLRRIAAPPERTRLPLAGLRLEVGFDDWVPATVAPTDALYDRLDELLDIDAEERFLDLGCGIGTISILASRIAREVVGVDINRQSIETAELNAVNHDTDNVEFVVGGWENALRKLALAEREFDVATINPMREPIGRRALSYLSRLGVERLLYLAPSPASGAKDVGELVSMGWEVDYLAAANIHPATYHTMLVARLHSS
jgi:23S rRNA (uracil1939-C5)-methyltransferase